MLNQSFAVLSVSYQVPLMRTEVQHKAVAWIVETNYLIWCVSGAKALYRRWHTKTRTMRPLLAHQIALEYKRPEENILSEWPKSAVCVQHSIDSRNSAIRSAYRILLRPSSMLKPRHPPLKVVIQKYEISITEWLKKRLNALRLSRTWVRPGNKV